MLLNVNFVNSLRLRLLCIYFVLFRIRFASLSESELKLP